MAFDNANLVVRFTGKFSGYETKPIRNIYTRPYTHVTVLFNPMGGIEDESARIFPDKEHQIGKLPLVYYRNHTFSGWFTDKSYSTQVFPDTPVTADMTLYAKWD